MADDVAKYDEFWAAFFGTEPEQLRQAGVRIVMHASLGDYAGVWFFVRKSSVIVSAPGERLEPLHSRTDRIAAEPLPSPRLLRELFGRDLDRVIGPVYQGCLPRDAFRPACRRDVRRLTPTDGADLLALRSACTAEEWDHSGLSTASDPMFGLFLGGQLMAAAGGVRWTANAVNPGVLAHPEQRGRGYGTAVVSAVVEHALAAGQLALYQTLMGNAGSVSIAERLGYEQYATHVAVRLQPASPQGGT